MYHINEPSSIRHFIVSSYGPFYKNINIYCTCNFFYNFLGIKTKQVFIKFFKGVAKETKETTKIDVKWELKKTENKNFNTTCILQSPFLILINVF